MSSSRHPVALRLERVVGDSGRLLATVMLLPLVDGIFPALVLAGALDTVAGILQVGLLVFGGSATVAVILAELRGSPRDHVRTVLLVGAPLLALAAVEAALAPTIAGVLDLAVFRRFAALVIAAVAASTASARVDKYIPRPGVIVGLGLVASVDPAGASFAIAVEPVVVARGVAAAAVGVAFALAVAAAAPRLRAVVDVDRFRFGSAVALGLLPLSLLGLPFGNAPLAVIAVTGLFAYAPDADPEVDEPASGIGTTDTAGTAVTAVTDGGDGAGDEPDDTESADTESDDTESDVEPGVGEERPPWL